MAARPLTHDLEPGPRYAVAWRDIDGTEAAGTLLLHGNDLVLRGIRGDGTVAHRRVPVELVVSVRIGRSAPERIRGERAVVLDLGEGTSVSVAPLGEAGAVFELADLLAELGAEARKDSRSVVVVAPLREGASTRARALVDEGPPFDLAAAGLDRHLVFVTEREVVLVFEGVGVRDTVERLLRRPAVLRAAAHWRGILAGRPRLGEASYVWWHRNA